MSRHCPDLSPPDMGNRAPPRQLRTTLIRRRRTNHAGLHVHGYKERGTTTTPFDMVMLNDLDRYHLVIDTIDRVPTLRSRTAALRQDMMDARLRARTRELGAHIPVRIGPGPGEHTHAAHTIQP